MLGEPTKDNQELMMLHTRGLNHSFIESVRAKLAKDPTIDLSSLFTQYQKHLNEIREKYGGVKKEEEGVSPEPVKFNFGAVGEGKDAAGDKVKPFTFGSSITTSVEEKRDAPKPFTFGQSIATAETKSATSTEEKSEALRPFTFGQNSFTPISTSTTNTAVAAATEMKPFTFGQVATETKPLTFGQAATEAKPFAFGQTTADPKPFSFNAEAKPFGPTEINAKPLAFNQSASESKPTFPFEAPTSSAGGKFQFSFGAPLPSFGQPSTGGTATEPIEIKGSDDEGIPIGEEDSFSNLRDNELIKTGVGEEDENSLSEQRCKLFIFEKEKGWTDLGVAIFKINQRKDDADKSRILARAEGSGRILINSWINVNTVCEHAVGKREFNLLCVQDGRPARYLVRVKEPDEARLLAEKITSLIPTV
jgi:hypothetical protein